MSKKESNSSTSRTRNYATVVYPESAPDNWQQIISESKIPVFISPLHDQDINPTGEAKKPHYHVLACYEGPKTKEQARDFFDTFGGIGCEAVASLRGYARYLCHLDNPDKAQYNPDDVKAYGGADYVTCIGLPTDKYKAIQEMIAFCCENGNNCYADLLEYASVHRMDWFRVLCDNGTVVMKEYLKSKTWKEERQCNS